MLGNNEHASLFIKCIKWRPKKLYNINDRSRSVKRFASTNCWSIPTLSSAMAAGWRASASSSFSSTAAGESSSTESVNIGRTVCVLNTGQNCPKFSHLRLMKALQNFTLWGQPRYFLYRSNFVTSFNNFEKVFFNILKMLRHEVIEVKVTDIVFVPFSRHLVLFFSTFFV